MKLLVHAINGVGLGHLTRTLEIAKALRLQKKDISIVFVTNCAFPRPLVRAGFKVYRLAYNAKLVLEGRLSYEAYLKSNYLRISAIIKKEQPDVVMMDSEFNAALVEDCRKNRIKTCFVLRDANNEKMDSLCRKGALGRVDLVLAAVTSQQLAFAQRDALVRQGNVHFVGPIIKNAGPLNKEGQKGVLRILILFSAGADIPGNRELFGRVSEFLAEAKKKKMRVGEKKLEISIITGPYFKERSCDLHGFPHKRFVDDLPSVMAGADLVISPAGYNLINEIIVTKTPALLLPVATRQDRQHERAKDLEEKGCGFIVQGRIWGYLERLAKTGELKEMQKVFPVSVPGNALAAQKIIDLIRSRPRVLVLRANWLPVSERFIYDELAHLMNYDPLVLCLHHDYGFGKEFNVLYEEKFSCLWTKDYPAVAKGQAGTHARLLKWAADQIKAWDVKLLTLTIKYPKIRAIKAAAMPASQIVSQKERCAFITNKADE